MRWKTEATRGRWWWKRQSPALTLLFASALVTWLCSSCHDADDSFWIREKCCFSSVLKCSLHQFKALLFLWTKPANVQVSAQGEVTPTCSEMGCSCNGKISPFPCSNKKNGGKKTIIQRCQMKWWIWRFVYVNGQRNQTLELLIIRDKEGMPARECRKMLKKNNNNKKYTGERTWCKPTNTSVPGVGNPRRQQMAPHSSWQTGISRKWSSAVVVCLSGVGWTMCPSRILTLKDVWNHLLAWAS